MKKAINKKLMELSNKKKQAITDGLKVILEYHCMTSKLNLKKLISVKPLTQIKSSNKVLNESNKQNTPCSHKNSRSISDSADVCRDCGEIIIN